MFLFLWHRVPLFIAALVVLKSYGWLTFGLYEVLISKYVTCKGRWSAQPQFGEAAGVLVYEAKPCSSVDSTSLTGLESRLGT